MFASLDLAALLIALAVFVLAVLVAWGLRRFQITDGVGFIVVILLPFLAYGVATGYVAKISLPGGWAAEFRAVARAEIRPAPLTVEVQNLDVVEKEGLNVLRDARQTLRPGKPIAISLSLGRPNYYSERAIAEYIRAFLTFDPGLTVIFVDQGTGGFVASANANAVLAAVEVVDPEQNFLRAVGTGDLGLLRQQIALTTATVSETTSNAEALQVMVADGVDSIVKTDASGKATGVVRRDDIVARLMVTLAESG